MQKIITADEYKASGYKQESDDALLEKYILIASTRVLMTSEKDTLTTMSQDELDAMKEATMLLIDH